MLKESVRRLLWLGPTVFALTVPLFWLLARATAGTHGAGDDLPLFFNGAPQGVHERALDALRRLADPRPTNTPGPSLATLGGAALPHVLPRFDALGPEARGRAALALAPVAERMGIGVPGDFESRESSVLFFSRFWQEHSIDFKPAISRRAVRRFAEHPSALRRSEVVELDTYALEDLIDAMSAARSAGDVALIAHLTEVAAHVTGNSWSVAPNASPSTARRTVRQWETWWIDHRHDYVAFTGTGRIAATLFETRYGQWVEQLSRRGLGTSKTGRSVIRTLAERVPVTLPLLVAGIVLGYPLALLLGAFGSLERKSRFGLLSRAAAIAVASLGVVGLCFGSGRLSSLLAAVMGSLLLGITGAATGSEPVRAAHDRLLELPWVRTEVAFGSTRLRIMLRACRFLVPLALALALADFPTLLTGVFVIERAFSLRGIGEIVISAVHAGDLGLLMALGLAAALVIGTSQILSDAVVSALDPRPVLAGGRRKPL